MRKINIYVLMILLIVSIFIGTSETVLASDIGEEGVKEYEPRRDVVISDDDIQFDKDTGYVVGYFGNASSLTIPSSIDGVNVLGIASYAFSHCSSLETVTINSGAEFIGEYAFMNCTSLSVITVPGSIETIYEWAFSQCRSLTSISLGDGVLTLGEYVFESCESLASITIPSSVTSIEDNCFTGCTGLQSFEVSSSNAYYSSTDGILFNKTQSKLVQYPANKSGDSYSVPGSVETINDGAFSGNNSLTTIYVPDSVTLIGEAAFYCESLTDIDVSADNSNYCDSDGVLFNKSMTEIIQYPPAKSSTSYEIQSGVTDICIGAFASCSNLITITMPDSVNAIEPFAFFRCSGLTSISIPTGVSRIEYATFLSCGSLTRVDMPTSVEFIAEEAFLECHENLAFYGTLGSYAQSYAAANGIPFYINFARSEDTIGDGILLRTFFNDSDDIVCKEYYRGPADTFARIQTDYFNMAGTMVFTEIYDLTDTIIASVWFQDDGVTKQFKNYYAEGQLYFQEEYDLTDTIIASIWFQADGYTKHFKNYYSNGTLYFQEEYDADGYIIASIWFQADGVTRHFKNYYEYGYLYFQEEYNTSGTMIASIDFRWDGTRERKCYYKESDGSLYLIEYYDENGDLIDSEWY